MFTKFIFAPIMLTFMTSTFSMNNSPVGNFGHFGPCVLKFIRLSDGLEYIDLTQYLIHINNPGSLIYTISLCVSKLRRFPHDSQNICPAS